MGEPVDVFRYIGYMRSRWRWVAGSCGIAATLPDARKAQALVRFLAESTVSLNRSMVTESDQDLLQGMEQQEREMRARLQEIDTGWAQVLASEPVDDLQSAMEQASTLR